jgi:hypothetical protein
VCCATEGVEGNEKIFCGPNEIHRQKIKQWMKIMSLTVALQSQGPSPEERRYQKIEPGNQTENESWRQKNQHQEPHIESLSSDPERGKATSTKWDPKLDFSFELKQEYNRSTKVTALPLSFDWNLETVQGTLLL